MGIGSFIGRLFGSDKALDTVVGGVSKGLDALVYTDEEKANDAKSERSEARRMVVAWMTATQGQNLARRLIALSVTFVWLLQYIIAQIFNVVAIWVVPEQAVLWSKSSDLIKSGATEMNGAVMLVLSFYFAAPYAGKIVDAAMERFKK